MFDFGSLAFHKVRFILRVHEQQMLSCPHFFLPAHALVFSSFVVVNSVAMEGDGCAICSTSEAKLVALSHKLNCSQQVRIYSRYDYSQQLGHWKY